MKEIKLTQDKVAIVDDDDFVWLSKYKWFYNGGYALRRNGKSHVKMHREIMNTPQGEITDHINGNKLDNRRKNLRIATAQVNILNRPTQKNNLSSFRGVSWHGKVKKWVVQIGQNSYKGKHIGYYDDKIQAALAYDIAAKAIFKEHAVLNFPEVRTNPYDVVDDFEKRIASWTGAPFAVAVESCSAAIFLCLMWANRDGKNNGNLVKMPKLSYPSVPCSIIHARMKPKFTDDDWEGEYQLKPFNIWDSALRFRKDMYKPKMMQCLSFHIKKRLNIGRGGMILLDSKEAFNWFRKARFDGRNPIPLKKDNLTMLGWNLYMTPEQAAFGIQIFESIKNKELPDLPVSEQQYSDLSLYKIYTQ